MEEEKVEELKTDEKVEELKTEKAPTKNQLLKQISEEWKIDAFNPNEVRKQFEEFNAYKEQKRLEEEAKKTELEKYQDKIKLDEETLKELTSKNNSLETELLFLKNGILDDDEREFLIFKLNKKVDEDNSLESLLKQHLKENPKKTKLIQTKPTQNEEMEWEKILNNIRKY